MYRGKKVIDGGLCFVWQVVVRWGSTFAKSVVVCSVVHVIIMLVTPIVSCTSIQHQPFVEHAEACLARQLELDE